jgi:serine/threonine protein kinase
MPIHFHNYSVVRECKGNQANKIYIVEEKESKQLMILKLIKIYDLDKQLREIEVHRRLNHKYVIKMIDYDINKTHIILLIEYAKYGDLFSMLPKLKEIPEKRLIKFYYQFLKAMDYLHSQGFVHRDIKPENILITRKFSPRLADFGTSAKTDYVKNTFCGTYEYMAPEIYQRQQQTEKVDIWAMGVLLYEMTHGFTPFKKKSVYEVKAILNDNKIQFQQNINPLIKRFILKILRFDPHDRPSTAELILDPLFAEFTKKKHQVIGLEIEHPSNTQMIEDEDCERFAEIPNENTAKMPYANQQPVNNQPNSVYHCPQTPMKKCNSFHNNVDQYNYNSYANHQTKNVNHTSNSELPYGKNFNEAYSNNTSCKDFGSTNGIASLFKIKSMIEEFNDHNVSKQYPANEQTLKPSTGAKQNAESLKTSMHNDPHNPNSSSKIFKSLYNKFVKGTTPVFDKKQGSSQNAVPKKGTLSNIPPKKNFMSLASIEDTPKHNNMMASKMQFTAFGKGKPEPTKVGHGHYQNVSYSVQELH